MPNIILPGGGAPGSTSVDIAANGDSTYALGPIHSRSRVKTIRVVLAAAQPNLTALQSRVKVSVRAFERHRPNDDAVMTGGTAGHVICDQLLCPVGGVSGALGSYALVSPTAIEIPVPSLPRREQVHFLVRVQDAGGGASGFFGHVACDFHPGKFDVVCCNAQGVPQESSLKVREEFS